MDIMVIALGAEDAEDELGRLLLDLAAKRTPSVGVDLIAAQSSCLAGGPADVLRWSLNEYDPKVVVIVDPEDEADQVDAIGSRSSSVVTRAAALGALRALKDDSGARPEMPEDARSLLATLARALSGPTPSRQIRDRNPRASVLIALYNQERFLHATMKSTLADTYGDFEVVVIDDGSTDASPQILAQYEGDPRVVVVRQENIGQTGRMDLIWNRAFRAARGELFAILGADDVALPHRLTAQVEAFDEDPGLGICHSASYLIDDRGHRIPGGIGLSIAYDELSFLRDMVKTNLVGHPTSMVSRKTIEQVGPMEGGIASDYHYWFKSAGKVRFRYLPQRLMEYRIHDRGLSTTTEGAARCARDASRLRDSVVRRRSLADLYPELVGVAGAEAWNEAGITLGNQLIAIDPGLALYCYDLAREALDTGDVHHNRAIALFALGDFEGANDAARRSADAHPANGQLGRSLASGTALETTLRGPHVNLSMALARGRRQYAGAATRWDGSPVGTKSAYVAFDRQSFALGQMALTGWTSSTRDGAQLRWVFPDLGSGTASALEHLAAAANGLDLNSAADLAIEVVDDLAILPPDEDRPTGILREPGHVEAFQAWIENNAGSVVANH